MVGENIRPTHIVYGQSYDAIAPKDIFKFFKNIKDAEVFVETFSFQDSRSWLDITEIPTDEELQQLEE